MPEEEFATEAIAEENRTVMLQRYFVRLPADRSEAMMPAIESADDLYFSRTQPDVIAGALSKEAISELRAHGAEVITAQRYDMLLTQPAALYNPMMTHEKDLDDVLSHINASQAWEISTGDGVHIAVVDTGTADMPEFPAAKRSPHAWAKTGDAWNDEIGHGSMVACIAAGTKAHGGRFNGVAPDATLISCRASHDRSFDETDLFEAYEHLIGLVEKKTVERLVINNSYGPYRSGPVAASSVFLGVVREAVSKGIVVVFAAGNNHVKICGNKPDACGGNSIWGANSLDEVLSVGTVNERNRMDEEPLVKNGYSHRDSSRGPGQLASTTTKPDCVAPTYGTTMWGSGYSAMEWWGTSGAAPQVAGLAALLLSRRPDLTVATVCDTIRRSCTDIGLGPLCGGKGLINCEKTLKGI